MTHTSGEVSQIEFPRDIVPHQPAYDIRALSSEGVTVAFEGDAFEMEDQRNWTDASFKTYNRALADPFPYLLDGPVTQRVTVTVAETLTSRPAPDESGGSVRPSPTSQALGELRLEETGPVTFSVGASTAPGAGSADPVGHDTLVEVDLGWAGWPAVIQRATASGLPLDVRLVLPLEAAEQALEDAIAALEQVPLARITAFQPPTHPHEHMADDESLRLLRTALGARDVPIIGGTRSHFTELNRGQHLVPPGLDGVAFSTTPMFDTREVLQLRAGHRHAAPHRPAGRAHRRMPRARRPRVPARAPQQRRHDGSAAPVGHGSLRGIRARAARRRRRAAAGSGVRDVDDRERRGAGRSGRCVRVVLRGAGTARASVRPSDPITPSRTRSAPSRRSRARS